jgi:large subunit ribosomal protein L9
MSNTKLILLQDVENLGLAGEEISVAPGYARNFLIPQGLAAKATTASLRKIAANKEAIEEKRRKDLEVARTLADKLGAMNIAVAVQASDDGHLFGSVTSRMVTEVLERNGVKLDHQKLHIDTHIRSLGEFKLSIKLHPEVTVDTKVNVVRA